MEPIRTTIRIKTMTPLRLKASLEELKPLLSKTSRRSSVVPEPRTPQNPCNRKQVCFLESPNFKQKKSVKFLLLPYQKENKPPPHHLQECILPVALRDPCKPPRYPPQPSQRYNHHRPETPKERHRRLLLIHQHQLQQAHPEETPPSCQIPL